MEASAPKTLQESPKSQSFCTDSICNGYHRPEWSGAYSGAYAQCALSCSSPPVGLSRSLRSQMTSVRCSSIQRRASTSNCAISAGGGFLSHFSRASLCLPIMEHSDSFDFDHCALGKSGYLIAGACRGPGGEILRIYRIHGNEISNIRE